MKTQALLALISVLLLSGCLPSEAQPTPIVITTRPAVEPGETPPPSTAEADVPFEVTTALMVALEHVRAEYGEAAPPSTLGWTAAYVTPEGILGSGRYRFTAAGWVIDISYPIVAPQNTIYTVTMQQEATGFFWEGMVRPNWEVSSGEPAASPTTASPRVTAEPAATPIPTATATSSPTPIPTPTPISGPTGTVNTAALNVRRLPDPTSPIVAVLVQNELVRLTGYRNPAATWVQITTLTNITGWVNAAYLNTTTRLSELTPLMIEPTATPPPSPTPVPIITEPVDGWAGIIVSIPASAQFDDYFERSVDQGRYGLTGVDEPVREQIAILRDSGLIVRLWGVVRYNVPDAYGMQIEVSYLVADVATVDNWTGTIFKNPWGSQYALRFVREDGRSFVLAGDSAVLAELEADAWTGVKVQLSGTMPPLLPGLIHVSGLKTISEPEMAARNLSFFAEATTSSFLPADRLGIYHGWSAVDGLAATAWCEGVSGAGAGEWLMLAFPHSLELSHLYLDVGYDDSSQVFTSNNRIKKATFFFSGDEPLTVEFEDKRGLQLVPLVRAPGPPIETTYVQIVIDEVYPGSLYDDSCLSEIEVWGIAR